MKLRQIKDYHNYMQTKGSNMLFMAFQKPDGYSWYSRGWVVSGYMGDDSHKFFTNRAKAQEFIKTIKK